MTHPSPATISSRWSLSSSLGLLVLVGSLAWWPVTGCWQGWGGVGGVETRRGWAADRSTAALTSQPTAGIDCSHGTEPFGHPAQWSLQTTTAADAITHTEPSSRASRHANQKREWSGRCSRPRSLGTVCAAAAGHPAQLHQNSHLGQTPRPSCAGPSWRGAAFRTLSQALQVTQDPHPQCLHL